MSVNKYTTAQGLVTLANGSRIWVGTKAAYEAAKQAGTMPNDVLVAITDDEQEYDWEYFGIYDNNDVVDIDFDEYPNIRINYVDSHSTSGSWDIQGTGECNVPISISAGCDSLHAYVYDGNNLYGAGIIFASKKIVINRSGKCIVYAKK